MVKRSTKKATKKKAAAPKPRRKRVGSKLNERREWENVYQLDNTKQQAILDFLSRHELLGSGSGDVARHLGIRQQEAIAHLAVLEKAGYVIQKRGEYRLTNKPVEK